MRRCYRTSMRRINVSEMFCIETLLRMSSTCIQYSTRLWILRRTQEGIGASEQCNGSTVHTEAENRGALQGHYIWLQQASNCIKVGSSRTIKNKIFEPDSERP